MTKRLKQKNYTQNLAKLAMNDATRNYINSIVQMEIDEYNPAIRIVVCKYDSDDVETIFDKSVALYAGQR